MFPRRRRRRDLIAIVAGSTVFIGLSMLLLCRRCRIARGQPPRLTGERAGFTVVELLVCVAIVSLLIALVLPSVQTARESSRRLSCRSRMGQFVLAVNNCASQHRVYPAASYSYRNRCGGDAGGFSPHSRLLPFLDRANVYESLPVCSPQNSEVRLTDDVAGVPPLDVFLCPSDGGGRCNLRVSLGVAVNAGLNLVEIEGPAIGPGAFFYSGAVSLNQITDGLSNTVFVSERLMGDASTGVYDPRRDAHQEAGVMLNPIDALRGCPVREGVTPAHYSQSGATWLYGSFAFTWFNQIETPNGPLPDCTYAGSPTNFSGSFAARSNHDGGVNVAFGDGSARFMSASIDRDVWRALGTRAGADEPRGGR